MNWDGCTLALSLSQSLHNLGLTHVLRMYICGGTMEDQQCTGEMAEYQYEAAWRCSMWENMETRWVKSCHGCKRICKTSIVLCVCVFLTVPCRWRGHGEATTRVSTAALQPWRMGSLTFYKAPWQMLGELLITWLTTNQMRAPVTWHIWQVKSDWFPVFVRPGECIQPLPVSEQAAVFVGVGGGWLWSEQVGIWVWSLCR